MNNEELSPQLQNQIAQFQQLQQQLQLITTQRYQLETKLNEIANTLEELKNLSKETPVYKSIGSLMIKAEDKEAIKNEINEQKETIEIRVKTLKRQEEHLGKRHQALKQQLSEALAAGEIQDAR